MRAFCEENSIKLEAEYSGIDWSYWRKMRAESGKGTE
jgi:hypothetical protein